MYIPNTMPATLADMFDFLEPGTETGLFDSVEYHYPSENEDPDYILCNKDNSILFRVALNTSTNNIKIIPYVNGVELDASSASHLFDSRIGYCMRCAGGFLFIGGSVSGSRQVIVIAKLSDGNTGSFATSEVSSPSTTNFNNYNSPIYPTGPNDNTDLKIYKSGWKVQAVYATDMDRTILAKIPFAGAYGSTGTFSTAFIRAAVQFYDTGEQIIGGKHYGCMLHIAILDE